MAKRTDKLKNLERLRWEETQRLRMENIKLHLELGHVNISLTKDEAHLLSEYLVAMADKAEQDENFEEAKTFNTILAKLAV